jgi:hypothetical protein
MKDILSLLLGVLVGVVCLLLGFAHEFFMAFLAEQKLGTLPKMEQQ